MINRKVSGLVNKKLLRKKQFIGENKSLFSFQLHIHHHTSSSKVDVDAYKFPQAEVREVKNCNVNYILGSQSL